ncbi:hypothetical protein GCQ56_08805 [Marinifilum sp. N1E240]|uniref:hypothetical protein n=1 Tax=Marinifilum sp. N1E240 TaxID=2608082 RepID=UPI00128BA14F|nr:hypothetical protein [Marinifilum sp. N1E240]MPQ47115.1 hypothetical protein [Marinifilum sp. N1E240]
MKRLFNKISGIIRVLIGGMACFAGIWLINNLKSGDLGNIIGFVIVLSIMEYYSLFLIISGWKQIVNQTIKNRIPIYIFLIVNTFVLIGFIWAFIDKESIENPDIMAIVAIISLCVLFGVEEIYKLMYLSK